ncbi:GntR family transcriptional regulator [Actinomycetospora sp. C-140]
MPARAPKSGPDDLTPDEAPVPRTTLTDEVYQRIRSAIIDGRLAAGAELNQVDLAKQFGVSRVPIREALRRLQAERLLVSNPFQRFVVEDLSAVQVLELHDIRAELEVFALRKALELPDGVLERRIEQAQAELAAMRPDMTAAEWLRADRRFHLILDGTDSAVGGLIEDIRDRGHRPLHLGGIAKSRAALVIREHNTILSALRTRDVELVEMAIRTHLDHTRKVLESIGSQKSAATVEAEQPA